MSSKQITRIHVIRACVEGLATTRRAAAVLGLTTRRVRQLKAEFKLHGEVVAIHGNSRRPSPKRLAEETRRRIVEIRGLEEHEGCDTARSAEILRNHYGIIAASRSTVARAPAEAGVGSPKARKARRRPRHPARARRAARGEPLQAGATSFDWFGDGGREALHGFIDDATGAATGLRICGNGCPPGYLEAVRQTLADHGIPMALYPDRHGVFSADPKRRDDPTIEERLAGDNERPAQFGRIMKTLGVDMFPARPPQAKGRIERLWRRPGAASLRSSGGAA